MTLASELGIRPLLAHCHLGLGTLYRRTGKREEAHDHLTTAATMYREMGMGSGWRGPRQRSVRSTAPLARRPHEVRAVPRGQR
jgi:hypothetical protein